MTVAAISGTDAVVSLSAPHSTRSSRNMPHVWRALLPDEASDEMDAQKGSDSLDALQEELDRVEEEAVQDPRHIVPHAEDLYEPGEDTADPMDVWNFFAYQRRKSALEAAMDGD